MGNTVTHLAQAAIGAEAVTALVIVAAGIRAARSGRDMRQAMASRGPVRAPDGLAASRAHARAIGEGTARSVSPEPVMAGSEGTGQAAA
jgi:hypothetical protein